MRVPRPFVKWPGGKSRVAHHVLLRLPERIRDFYEPMLGGGAVFIELARSSRIAGTAVLNDSSPELMNAWRVVQSSVEELVAELRSGEYVYDREVFLRIREVDPESLDPVRRAARFIYLSKTCFNGLYRVNRSGGFNVPFGRYVNPMICDEENLLAVSALLRGVTLTCEDFGDAVAPALERGGPGDAVYFDPPYVPLSKTSNFTSYTSVGFSLDDHVRIAVLMRRLSERGIRSVVSNSSAPASLEIFGGFDVDYLRGARSVGGPADYRKSVKEIVAFAGQRA